MTSFESMGLNPEILRAIDELGFESPTPIQEKAIPTIISGKNDLVVLAQTGTGKTAAFGLPVLQMSDNDDALQTLVLCPTRELCLQITTELNRYAKYMNGIKVVPIYGGASIRDQIRLLRSGNQIVVGTPGRVLDMIERKALNLSTIRWMILDEADEMLNMGFKEDLDTILSETPKKKQTLLFSATMPDAVAKIARNYMNQPEEISVGVKNSGADNVSHEYFMIHAKDKYLALKRIVDVNPSIYGIVFCRTRAESKEIADKLMQDGYNADALHGDLSQSQRDYVMNRFRCQNIQLLVATDVAARGLDVQDLTHIINYNIPDDPEVYVHRSGRTGRAGKTGISVSLIHTRESRRVKDLERLTKKTFERKMVPGGKEICEKQLLNLIDKMENTVVDEENIGKYLPSIFSKLEKLEREELIKRFISVEFNRFLEYYKDAVDLNATHSPKNSGDEQPLRASSYKRFHINLGLKDGLSASALISFVNRHCSGSKIAFGKIEILRKFSFFEADVSRVDTMLKDLENARFDGLEAVIQPAEGTGFSQDRERERGRDSYSSRPKSDGFKSRKKDGFRSPAKDGFRSPAKDGFKKTKKKKNKQAQW